ncbi:hypothetical protein MUP77_11945 [Candidatus Bathyarchaeota archaeon]|nr:hypothetical protein [Candidatus Bathyarchaeota archaeon]
MSSPRVQTFKDFREQSRTFSVKMIYCLFEDDSQGKPPIGMRLLLAWRRCPPFG